TDPATGKVWMAARWYDAASGRFLSRDALQPAIRSAADANLYGYGRANPLVNVDPSGSDVLGCPSWLGGAIGVRVCNIFGRGGGSQGSSDISLQDAMSRVLGRGQSQTPNIGVPVQDPSCPDIECVQGAAQGSGPVQGSPQDYGPGPAPCQLGCA